MRKAWMPAAILYSLFTALSGIAYLRMSWTKPIDFDVVGFLWVFQNMGRLGTLAVFILCAVAAGYFWIRVLLQGR